MTKPINAQVVKVVRPEVPERPTGYVVLGYSPIESVDGDTPLEKFSLLSIEAAHETAKEDIDHGWQSVAIVRIPSERECKLREERRGLVKAVLAAVQRGVYIELSGLIAALDAFDREHPEIAGGGA